MKNSKAEICTNVIDIYFKSLEHVEANCKNCLHAVDIKKHYYYCPMIDCSVNNDFVCCEFIYKDETACEKLWQKIMSQMDEECIKTLKGES